MYSYTKVIKDFTSRFCSISISYRHITIISKAFKKLTYRLRWQTDMCISHPEVGQWMELTQIKHNILYFHVYLGNKIFIYLIGHTSETPANTKKVTAQLLYYIVRATYLITSIFVRHLTVFEIFTCNHFVWH